MSPKQSSVPAFSFHLFNLVSSRKHALPALALTAICSFPNTAAALGVTSGLLSNCQSSPLACVSSQDDTPTCFLEPWEHDGDVRAVQNKLIAIISGPNSFLQERSENYLRFEIVTSPNQVADDLEFFFPPDDNLVHFRSARHDNTFDFLANRRRLNRIRQEARLSSITVLRGRNRVLNLFETPFDSFAPSGSIDTDALIEYGGIGSRPSK